MIRVLLAGKLNAGVAEGLREIPEFEIIEEKNPDRMNNHTAGLEGMDAAVVDSGYSAGTDFLNALSGLRLLIRTGSGTPAAEADAAPGREIEVRHTPFSTAAEVADYAAALILTCIYRIEPAPRGAGPARRPQKAGEPVIRELGSMTLGIAGFGTVGMEVAKRAAGMGLHVVYSDIEEVQSGLSVRRVPFQHLPSIADALFVHLPLTPETRGMISTGVLEQMPGGSVLVDMSAPGVVDVPAVMACLAEKRLSAAALDLRDHRDPPAAGSVYSAAPAGFVAANTTEHSGNDVISILKEFFNV